MQGWSVSGNEPITRDDDGDWVYVFSDREESDDLEEVQLEEGDKVGSLTRGLYIGKVLLGRPTPLW